MEEEGPGPIQVTIRNIDAESENEADSPVLSSNISSDLPPIDADAFSEKLMYRYPHLALGRTPQLISVSSVKEEALDEIEEVIGPNEAGTFEYSEERLSGSERGTLFHTIAAMADPSLLEQGHYLEAMGDLAKRGIIQHNSIQEIPVLWIRNWATSDLFRRMRKSVEIYHEEPFVMSVPVQEMKKISTVVKDVAESEDKEIMIQGIIDLFFRENDGFVLVDYKTDQVLDEGKIHGYGVQLSLYQRAIEKATSIPVKEKKLFDVRRGREIPC